MTTRDINFYFDFISPYGYLAAREIEKIGGAFGYAINWRPFRLGISVVKVMGLRPMMETPLKSDYVRRDVQRLSAIHGVPIRDDVKMPDPVLTGSAFYWVDQHDRAVAVAFAAALYASIWTEGRTPEDIGQLQEILVRCGGSDIPPFCDSALETGRRLLKEATNEAIAQGVFGSPTFEVDGELIWGSDRLWMLAHYLEHGRWRTLTE